MARASYLIKKDGRFWLQKRFAVKPGIAERKPTHLRICLRTSDYRSAIDRMLRLMFEIQAYEFCEDLFDEERRLVADLRRFVDKGVPRSIDELLERRPAEAFGQRYLTAARLRSHPTSNEFWPLWMTFINQTCDGEIQAQTSVDDAYERGRRDAPQASAMKPHTSSPSNTWRRQLPFLPADSSPPIVPTQAASRFPNSANEQAENGDIDLGLSSTLSGARAEYLDYLAAKKGDRRADEDVGIVLLFLIDMVGDKPLKELSAADLLKVERALPEVPDRKGLPRQASASLHSRWTYGEKKGRDSLKPLSRKRLSVFHSALNCFLKWLREKAVIVLDFQFSLVGDVNLEPTERDVWTDEEAIRLFSLPLFTGCQSSHRIWVAGGYLVQGYLYWAYIIAFMLGLRPSEISKLTLDSVVCKAGIYYIDLKFQRRKTFGDEIIKLKTKSSARLMPIPQLLVDLGLIDRYDELKKLGEKMLFPEAKIYDRASSGRVMWGHSFSKSWQYIKKKFGFDREALTIYGGRHTRAGWYDELGLPSRVRDRLMGHSRRSVSDGYGPIDVTKREAGLLASEMTPTQAKIAEILIEAKLRALEGELTPIHTWRAPPPSGRSNGGVSS